MRAGAHNTQVINSSKGGKSRFNTKLTALQCTASTGVFTKVQDGMNLYEIGDQAPCNELVLSRQHKEMYQGMAS